jgi:hypothetical protein
MAIHGAVKRALIVLLAFALSTHALHFYLESNEQRCFIEELPSETIVEGHYQAFEWNEEKNIYEVNDKLGIQVDVEEVETDHEVVKTRGPHESRFTFTSHTPGDHSICLSTNYTKGWFSNRHIKLYLDIVVGAAKHDVEHDRAHIGEVASKIRDLNEKLVEIRIEQQYQREREANFRDLSEATNSRAAWYCVLQIAIIFATCYWQLRYLKDFFEDRR